MSLVRSQQTLIYATGIMFENPIESIPDSQWNLQISVLLTAPFHLIKRCLPAMKDKGMVQSIHLCRRFPYLLIGKSVSASCKIQNI